MPTKADLRNAFRRSSQTRQVRNSLAVDKERAEADVNYFAEAVLGLKQAEIHRQMQAFWDANRYCIARAPIGFGKSTQLLNVRTLWLLAGDQDASILHNSSSMANLEFYVGKAQATLMQNKKLQSNWPHMVRERRKGWPTAWNKHSFMIQKSEKWMDENGGDTDLRPSVMAISTGSQKQGIRANYIFPDDPLGAMTVWSETTRITEGNWLNNTLLSRQSFGASTVQGIGTPHHINDWCHDVVENRGFGVQTWDGDDYKTLWPEREAHILRMRTQLKYPSAEYDRLIKCKPYTGSLVLFDADVLRACAEDVPYGIYNQEPEASNWTGYCGVDVAGTKKTRRSANTCFVPWLITPQGVMRLVEIRSEKGMDTEKKMRTFLEIHRRFPRMIFVVEDNNTQDMLADVMRNATLISALKASPEEVAAITSRIQTWTTTGQKKRDHVIGIPAMDASFRAKRIEYRANGPTNTLINHFIQYSPEAHPADDLMAAWIGWAWLHDRRSLVISPEAVIGVGSDYRPLESVGGIGELMPDYSTDNILAEMSI